MGAEQVEASKDEVEVVVYIKGCGADCKDKWYRVEFEPKEHDKRGDKRRKIQPAAELCQETYGIGGSWAVVGDDIYVIGGFNIRDDLIPSFAFSSIFRKHSVIQHSENPGSWDPASNPMRIPRSEPFVAALGRKLFVVAGREHKAFADALNAFWDRCGQYHDLDLGTWRFLKPKFDDFEGFDACHAAPVQRADGQEPTQVVFYSLCDGSVMFLDLTDGGKAKRLSRPHDSLTLPPSSLPKGLKDCVGYLRLVCGRVRPVFANHTFYWFSLDLRLYGYDMKARRWFWSPSLAQELPTLVNLPSLEAPPSPILLPLPSGDLLVVASEGCPGKLTMASLSFSRAGNSLSVSVKSIQAFSLTDLSFEAFDAKAVYKSVTLPIAKKRKLKKTAGSGTMRRLV